MIMRGIWYSVLAAGLLTLVLRGGAWAGAEVGSPAPDFCLPSSQGEKVCLKDFKGKDNVVLLFYLLDFTPG
jgi:cytochrome oxidase Cu insertion factor (SCO1/SenC/PrrC family)